MNLKPLEETFSSFTDLDSPVAGQRKQMQAVKKADK